MIQGFEIPIHVMCDSDSLFSIENSIEISRKKVKTSSIIRQLSLLSKISDEDLIIISDIEKNIIKNIKGNEIYDPKIQTKLTNIIRKYDFITVLSSDFEGLFSDNKYAKILAEAEQQFHKNKVLKGRYVAENISDIPTEISAVIKKTIGLV